MSEVERAVIAAAEGISKFARAMSYDSRGSGVLSGALARLGLAEGLAAHQLAEKIVDYVEEFEWHVERMNQMKQYFQCRLRKGGAEQTAWLEARGAKVGATVELLPSREPWSVVEVFDHGLPEDMLREQQKLNRHSLPSVDPIA